MSIVCPQLCLVSSLFYFQKVRARDKRALCRLQGFVSKSEMFQRPAACQALLPGEERLAADHLQGAALAGPEIEPRSRSEIQGPHLFFCLFVLLSLLKLEHGVLPDPKLLAQTTAPEL